MARPFKLQPESRILVDWDNDGSFAHPFSDLTPDLHSYFERHGASMEDNPADIVLTRAKGTVRVENRNNRYSPEGSNRDITQQQLRRPHACRIVLVADSPAAGPWVGTVQYSNVDASLDRPSAGWSPIVVDDNSYTITSALRWDRASKRFEFGSAMKADDLPTGYTFKVENLTTGVTAYYRWDGFTDVVGQAVNWRHPGNYIPANGDSIRITLIRYYRVVWNGTIINNIGSQLTRNRFVDFTLESANFKEYHQELAIDGGSESLSSFAQKNIPTSMYKADNIRSDTTAKVGIAQFSGTTLQFLNTLAIYNNGWPFEDKDGKFGMAAWAEATAVEPTITLSSEDYKFTDDTNDDYRYKYIRNQALAEALAVQTGNVVILPRGTRTFNTRDLFHINTQRREYEYPTDDIVGVDFNVVNAFTLEQIGGGPGATQVQAQVDAALFEGNPRKVAFRLVPAALPGQTGFVDGSWRLTLRGRIKTIGTAVVFRAIEQDSINDWGVEELPVPTWYPPDGTMFPLLDDFINRLGTPLRYFRMFCPLVETDIDKLDTIMSLDCGHIINVRFVNRDNILTVAKVLLLMIRYQQGWNQTPIKGIFGIGVEEGQIAAARWYGPTSPSSQKDDRWGKDSTVWG